MKGIFPKNILSCQTLKRPVTPCRVSKKTNEPIPRETGRTNAENQTHGPMVTTRGPKIILIHYYSLFGTARHPKKFPFSLNLCKDFPQTFQANF